MLKDWWIFAGLFAALAIASLFALWLARRRPGDSAVANLIARIRSWWVMVVLGGAAYAVGKWGIVCLFAALSAMALREFMVPPKVPGSRWIFVALPCGLAFVAVVAVMEGPRLALFLVLIAQTSDVFQYIWGKLLGRRKIAPRISPEKTVEGFAGGMASATALGAWVHGLTPYSALPAAMLALLVAVTGFAGGLVLSRIKRARGVKDWGSLIEGHGGVLDRVDSLWLSAPIFFHVVWWNGL